MSIEAIGSSEDPQFAIISQLNIFQDGDQLKIPESCRAGSLSVRRSSQQLCAMPIELCSRAAQRKTVGLGMRTVAVEEM